jgi:HK97 family phage prohead protease
MDKAPIELRRASVTDVRFPERVIDLVAVPYDEWTEVEYHGRIIAESFAPGSFGGVRNRRDRFMVNLEHDVDHVVGRVLDLHPDRTEGLVSELFIRRGDEGNQVLDDAADGMLCGSVGFGVLPEHQQWEGRERRRIVKAFLDHIALVFQPAYAGAGVIGVRSRTSSNASTPGPPATPNLDRIRAERLAASYAALR